LAIQPPSAAAASVPTSPLHAVLLQRLRAAAPTVSSPGHSPLATHPQSIETAITASPLVSDQQHVFSPQRAGDTYNAVGGTQPATGTPKADLRGRLLQKLHINHTAAGSSSSSSALVQLAAAETPASAKKVPGECCAVLHRAVLCNRRSIGMNAEHDYACAHTRVFTQVWL
jgi:hypothetical protein